jgi:MFS family permease
MREGPRDRDATERPSGRTAFSALRYRDFRLLWSAAMIGTTGSWMQQVAQSWLIYDLTGSPLLVGMNGLIRTVPFLLMSLYAGTLVDRLDRRKILLTLNVLNFFVNIGLTLLIFSGLVEVWHVYAVSLITAILGAFDIPTGQALLPHLVPRKDIMNAVSLNALIRKGTQIIGPSLGGLSVAAVGVAPTYLINALTYILQFFMVLAMRSSNPPSSEQAKNPLQAIGDGLGYVRGEAVIGRLLLMDTITSIFGSYNSMLVFFARDVFEAGPAALGLLQSAPGIGTVAGSLALSLFGDVRHKGRIIITAGLLNGLALFLFAITRSYPLALVFLMMAGMADVFASATRTTIIQLHARRDMLGRVMSLQGMATRGVGQLGSFQVGTMGSLIGVPAAVAVGGLACMAIVLAVGWTAPALRNYIDGAPPDDSAPTGGRPHVQTAPIIGQRPKDDVSRG